MSIQELHTLFLNADGICTDTRKLKSGEIFFALSGPSFNGNSFAAFALEQGAQFTIVDDASYVLDNRCILVGNALKCLQELASYHRNYWGKKIIGLTGSNGKTTTKELLHNVLSTKYNVLSTIGNLNNHIGVPLTLLRLKDEHELGIIEMGANHQYEIEELSKIAQPNFGLITNIGKAHLEGFGTQDIIAKSKRELFDFVETNEDVCFVNASDSFLNTNDYKTSILFNKDYTVTPGFYCSIEKNGVVFKTNLVGNVNAPNVDAAIVVGEYFGVDVQNIKKAIESYVPSNNRSEKRDTSRNELILDAYNANPSSMTAAVKDFSAIDHPHKLAILGTMAELGTYTKEEHEKLLELCQSLHVQAKFIGVGYAELNLDYSSHFSSTDDIHLQDLCKGLDGYLILLKGSRSQGLEKLVPLL